MSAEACDGGDGDNERVLAVGATGRDFWRGATVVRGFLYKGGIFILQPQLVAKVANEVKR